MSGSLKPTRIVVDYQRERFEADESRKKDVEKEEGPSGLFYLSVWARARGCS